MKTVNLKSILFLLLFVPSCIGNAPVVAINDAQVLHNNQDQLTQVIIYDVFTPPVAARIYGYTSLASYEAMRYADPKAKSIITQLKGFDAPPKPINGKSYNYTLAATCAFFTVAHKVTFSIDSFKNYERKVYNMFNKKTDDSTFVRSKRFGEAIGKVILKRANQDTYTITRGKPRYLGTDSPGRWRPTPPDYLDGVEFCWGGIKEFAISSASQFEPAAPPVYSEKKNSPYFLQSMEVYKTAKSLTKSQIEIARFWDDNPFVIEHNGHMNFANKKITPAGHWMGITAIACKVSHASAVKTAQAYALTAVALFDSFISCWHIKYKYSYARPVTVINSQIDPNWTTLLQTPPFPEYTAGHATISAAAAAVLTHEFGSNFAFQDTSDLRYIGMQRHFTSFKSASEETSVSRFYGGIHFLNSVKKGEQQGNQIGNYIWSKLKLSN